VTTASAISEQDLRRMLDVVSLSAPVHEDAVFPKEVLRGLAELIPCSAASYNLFDPHRSEVVAAQDVVLGELRTDDGDSVALYFQAFWDCMACCRPDLAQSRPGIAIRWLDLYTEREFRSLLMAEYFRVMGFWHDLLIPLPASNGQMRHIVLQRERGEPPFSERDRMLLTLLRPHLVEVCQRVEDERRETPDLTPRQVELLRRVARGDTNRQVARDLGVSEGTVRKHLENIYARLDAHSRTEALARAGDLLVG
jgi:DNA-binding CsgD family transcriptional regulator